MQSRTFLRIEGDLVSLVTEVTDREVGLPDLLTEHGSVACSENCSTPSPTRTAPAHRPRRGSLPPGGCVDRRGTTWPGRRHAGAASAAHDTSPKGDTMGTAPDARHRGSRRSTAADHARRRASDRLPRAMGQQLPPDRRRRRSGLARVRPCRCRLCVALANAIESASGSRRRPRARLPGSGVSSE
jgi:hypothetical protein